MTDFIGRFRFWKFLVLSLIPSAAFSQQESPKADALPLAPLHSLSLTVEEGTWISVDVSPDGQWLAFDLLGQVFALPIDGGLARQRTAGPAYATQPRFSSDGQWLVFTSDQSGGLDRWRIPVQGGAAPTPLPPEDTAQFPMAYSPSKDWAKQQWRTPAFSPDGRVRARYIQHENQLSDCWYLELTDSAAGRTVHAGTTPLCGYAGSGLLPPRSAFTPDGRAFITWFGGKLWRIELATGAERIIPFTAVVTLQVRPLVRFPHAVPNDSLVWARRIEHPRISSDERQIAFGAFGRLWIMALPQGTPRRLTDLDLEESEPVWSPDGRYIAFATWPDTGWGGGAEGALYRVRTDGRSLPERLIQRRGRFKDLAYTSDGRLVAAHGDSQLVWTAMDGGVFTARAPLSNEQPGENFDSGWGGRHPLPLPHGAEFPVWAPGGRSLTYALGATLYRYDVARADSLVRDSIADAAHGRPARDPAYTPSAVPIAVAQPRDRPRGTIAFRNARLITMRGDTVIEHGDLLIRDRRIVALGPRGTVAIPQGAHLIDATGQTIMPGLVDVHNHVGNIDGGFRIEYDPAMARAGYESDLAHGVLTSRDPQASSLNFLAEEDRAAAGQLLAPRVRSTGPAIGNRGQPPIESLTDARAIVGLYTDVYEVGCLKERQAFRAPRRDVRQWLVMAAAERGLNVVSHGSGYDHLVQSAIDGYGGYDHQSYVWPLYDDARQLLARTGLTLAHQRMWYKPNLRDFALDSAEWATLLRWWIPTQKVELGAGGIPTRMTATPARIEELRQAVDSSMARLAAAGGRVAVGAHGEQGGWGTHLFMWALAQGGMPILEALRSGTLRGAEALGLDQDLGSLVVGKLADIIVLNRNPLERIQHTLDIRYVFFNGRLYDAATLDELWPRRRARQPWW